MTTQQALIIERNAKNRAYAFILALGLLKEFAAFCEATQDSDPYKLSRQALDNQ